MSMFDKDGSLSRKFLLERGSCCNNGCKNCPYNNFYIRHPLEWSYFWNIDFSTDQRYDIVRKCCRSKALNLRGSRIRLVQSPVEIVDFALYFKDKNIKSYYEVGVSTGGTFLFMDSALRHFNNNYELSFGIDCHSKLRFFQEYKQEHKNIYFEKTKSRKILPDRKYDLVFIDAHHSYDSVKKDFDYYKKYANYVAFHDILLDKADEFEGKPKRSTVFKFWEEIKKDYDYNEICDQKVGPGIGIIKV